MRARVAIQSLFVPNTHDRREIATRNKAMYSCAEQSRAKRFTGKTIDVIAQVGEHSYRNAAVKPQPIATHGSIEAAIKYTHTQKNQLKINGGYPVGSGLGTHP